MKLHLAFAGSGPKGETHKQIRAIILGLMQHYNMHHVPSQEMEELDLNCFFLAEVDGKYAGASGYKMLPDCVGKTTLLAVDPQYAGKGIGYALQQARVTKMRELGATKVITNADRPASIAWYKKQGYVEIGKVQKLHSFGWDGADSWTTLELLL